MIKKIGMLMAVAAIVASMTVPSALACATRTPGYWKKHAWPTSSITIGGVLYTEAAARAILNTPPKGGDAWIILAQKVIAGKLSMLADPGPHWDYPGNFPGTDTFLALITAADAWLATHTSPCGPGSLSRADGLALAEDIDYWLNWYDVD